MLIIQCFLREQNISKLIVISLGGKMQFGIVKTMYVKFQQQMGYLFNNSLSLAQFEDLHGKLGVKTFFSNKLEGEC